MSALQALADPTRQRIVEMLAAGALSSGEIAGRFALSPPAISQHLKTLKAARLVTVRADKQKRYHKLYYISRSHFGGSMTDENPWYDTIVIPVLLRGARKHLWRDHAQGAGRGGLR